PKKGRTGLYLVLGSLAAILLVLGGVGIAMVAYGPEKEEPVVVAKAEEEPKAPPTPPAPTLHKVSIRSNPENAAVYVDGKKQTQTTPLELDLPPGIHTVKVKLAGYASHEENIEITEEKAPELVTFNLVAKAVPPMTRDLHIRTRPEGVAVYVNDEPAPRG